jgi:ABC-type transport system involved in cytochrome bd biosynthesis fused ATPase/permease subunit
LIGLLKSSLSFLSPAEKKTWVSFTFYRSAMALIDLVSLLFLAILTFSVVKNLTGDTASDVRFTLAGFNLPLVPPQLMLLGTAIVLLLFLGKSAASLIVYRRLVFFLSGIDARIAKRIAQGILGTKRKKNFNVSPEELNYAISTGTNSAFSAQLNAWSVIFAESTLFVTVLLGFLALDPLTAMFSLIYFSLVTLFVGKVVQKRAENRGRKGVKYAVETHTYLTDLFDLHSSGISSKNLNYFLDRIQRAKLETSNAYAMQLYLSSVPRYVIESALAVGVVSLATIQLASSDFLTSATLMSVFLAGGFRLSAALLPIQAAVISLRANAPKSQSALHLLETTPLSDEIESESLVASSPIGFRLKEVSFEYPGSETPAVKKISFEVPPSEHLFIIGKSGSGKTSVAELIAGNVSPSEGSLEFFLQGSSYTYSHSEVSYVQQRPRLISGTLFENIAVSEPASEENVNRVLKLMKLVQLENLLLNLPEGLMTNVGKLRDSFSGGEIQRIVLARALFPKPQLLVLDEFTSSLDNETERRLLEGVFEEIGSATLVVITHRLHNIPSKARVLQLGNGKLIADCPFSEVRAFD